MNAADPDDAARSIAATRSIAAGCSIAAARSIAGRTAVTRFAVALAPLLLALGSGLHARCGLQTLARAHSTRVLALALLPLVLLPHSLLPIALHVAPIALHSRPSLALPLSLAPLNFTCAHAHCHFVPTAARSSV